MAAKTSIHGKRLMLLGNGLLQVDGNIVGPLYGSLGKTFYVDSVTGSAGSSGLTPDDAVTTITLAIAKCTENKGDTVIVLPNHAETITGVGGLTVDKAGITIQGLGNYNQRPRLLMDGGTTVTCAVPAADVTIRNIEFAAGHLLVATGIDTTAPGATYENLAFTDNTTAENWGSPFKATGAANTADGLTIRNCTWTPLVATVNALEFLEITDDIRNLVVEGNTIIHEGTASPLVLQAGTKVMQCARLVGNYLSHKMTAGDLLIDNGGATNSGIVADNYVGNADVTGAQGGGAATGMRFFNNLYTSTATESGALEPAADTPLS